MSKEFTSTKVVREYCKKYPDTPDMTLAKLIFNKEKNLFKTLENCRSIVRKIRGHHGVRDRNLSSDKSLFKELNYNYNPFNLPESHSEIRDVFKMPKSIKKVLVLSDIHFPYHDSEAITTALTYGKQQGIDCIYLNGDILDFYQVSFHEKDPRKMNLAEELQMGRGFLKELRKHFNCPIYFIPGNHEHRLERYLKVKAPELLDIDEFRLDVLLKLGENRIEYLKHGTKVYFGKLLVEHGDKMRGFGGVNPARTLLLKFKRATLSGHFHRTTSANSKVYDDSMHMAWTTGCLCELEPGYMELNEHNHGFAIVNINDDDTFSVDNRQIINGQVF